MKNIVGLDLGTNSIGWARISIDETGEELPKIKLGSRIIPMDQGVMSDFDKGVTQSQTAKRTGYRGVRRLHERSLLRRQRLLRVLHILNFLPEHYDNAIGWNKNNNKTYGKFVDDSEPKVAWKRNEEGKMEFIFMDAFHEMLDDFRTNNPEFLSVNKNVPLDWTIYYLRHKALFHPISKQELAWILLSFNQKRGYYQLRGEDEDVVDKTKVEEYYELRVVDVKATDEKKGDNVLYNIMLDNGWVYKRTSKISLDDWKGKVKEFIVTTEYDKDGKEKLNKEGEVKRSFRAPKEDDWKLQKKRTESSIEASGMCVGSYIYKCLLTNPTEKVRGKLVRTIERKFYKRELIEILQKQAEYMPELTDTLLLEDCVKELYTRNKAHQESLMKKSLAYLLVEDIIFYQRPLKSKKSLIANCPYEQYEYVDKATGEVKVQHIKCVAKSNPYYQEFRLWQFVRNLRLFSVDGIDEKEVTADYFKDEEEYVRLFKFLNGRKDVTQDVLMKDFFGLKKPKGKGAKYPVRWNYVEDKTYPCNETRHILLNALQKAGVSTSLIDDRNIEYRLWHLLYSVDDRTEIIHALNSYAENNNLPDTFVESFKKIPSFKKEYGAYSEKAIKKLLSVMRLGSMWNTDDVAEEAMQIIDNQDEKISERIARHGIVLSGKNSLRGLPVWLACYAVYGRHSEAQDIVKWKTPNDLACFINNFKQYSMRNPIVEQCVLETLRTIHDLWKECGRIDEIHVELGRSMKSTADQRKRMNDRNLENENTNIRIKQLLLELKNDGNVQGVRPYSPSQQEILRIYEEGALQELHKEDDDFNDILRISKLAMPTRNELIRYKLWLEQKYLSPYTNRPISLTKLFTPAYEIEHVIPQKRFFDDSLSNKVICEAEVNRLKSAQLGYEFIKSHGGEIVQTQAHGDVKILSTEEYKEFVTDHYVSNKPKARKLMMDDIPEEFIQRQMNDSRYISKVIVGLLSNVVRDENEVEAISKNVIPCTGGITDRLKNDWGLNDIWNRIVASRFERMNRLTESEAFGHWEDKEGKRVFQTTMPIELQRSFSKKRIDHRHHAMDALVIALASRNIVSYLNNESARDTQRRENLRVLLCDNNKVIRKPWETFAQDAMVALQDVVVSFKHYIRVVNKATNYYEHYNESGKKVSVAQKTGEQWAVRQSLHDQFVFAHVNLRRTKRVSIKIALKKPHTIVDKKVRSYVKGLLQATAKVSRAEEIIKKQRTLYGVDEKETIEVYYYTDETTPQSAIRRLLDTSFDIKKISNITDTGIQKILINYLHASGDDPTIAFTPEGIASMNESIEKYNNGKPHKPIVKVRVCEALGAKFPVGEKGNKLKKYVQGAPHLFLGIYEMDGVRSYITSPLNEVVERQKQGLCPVPEKDAKGWPLKFFLSPNDLVYAPTQEERLCENIDIDKSRIFRFVSSEGTTVYFLPISVASLIMKKKEFESLDKSEKVITYSNLEGKEEPIKTICWKLEVDRLGNITKIIR